MEHSNRSQGMIDRCIVEGLSKTKLLLKLRIKDTYPLRTPRTKLSIKKDPIITRE